VTNTTQGKYIPSPEGVLLRTFRIRADVTQGELSFRMKVSPSQIGLVENGYWRPSSKYISKFAAALGLNLAEEQRILALRVLPWKRQQRKPDEAP
jgi:transcriptional regulator with XRE-family HTH domain